MDAAKSKNANSVDKKSSPIAPINGSVSAIVKDLNETNNITNDLVKPVTKDSFTNITESVKAVNEGYNELNNSTKIKQVVDHDDEPIETPLMGVIKGVDKYISAIVNIFSKPQPQENGGVGAPMNEVVEDYDKKVANALAKMSAILQPGQFLDKVIDEILEFDKRWRDPLEKRFGMIKVVRKNQEGTPELVDEKQTTSVSLAADVIGVFSGIISNLVTAFDNTAEIQRKILEGSYGMYHTLTFLGGMVTAIMNFDNEWFPILNERWGKMPLKKMITLKTDGGGEVLQEIEEQEFRTNAYIIIAAVLGNVTKCLELINTILEDKNVSEIINNPENIKKKLSSLPTLFEDMVNMITDITTKLSEVIKDESQAKGIVAILTSLESIFKNIFEMAKILEENTKIYKGGKYINMMKNVRAFIDASIGLIKYISESLAEVAQNTDDAKKNIDNVVAILKNLVQIPILLLKLAGTFLLAIAFTPLILIALLGMKGLIIFVTKLFRTDDTAENAQKNVENVEKIITSLAKIPLQLIKLAGTFLLAIAFTPIIYYALKAVVEIVWYIDYCFWMLDSTQESIDAIMTIFKNLYKIPLYLIKLAGTFLLALLVSPLILLALAGIYGLVRYIVFTFGDSASIEASLLSVDNIILVLKSLVKIPILLIELAIAFLIVFSVSPIIMLALVSIYGLMLFIAWLFNNDSIIDTIEKIKISIDNVMSIIKTLVKLSLQLILLALISAIAIVAMIPVMLFMGALMLFIIGVNFLFKAIDKFDGQKTQLQIDNLLKIITPLVSIAYRLILLALISVIAIVAMIPVMIFMGTLIAFTMLLKIVLTIIDKFDGRKTRAKLWGLIRLILILNLVALSLILLAVVSMVVIIAFMIGLTLLILVIWLISWLLSKVISKKMILHLLELIVVILILLIISAMILVIALIAAVVAPHWLDILIFMGVMVGVIVIAVLIGWLAMLAAPIIGVAIVGLILILVLIGIILGIALCLKLIAEIDLDPEAVMKGVRTVFDTAWFVVENIFNPDKDAEKKDGDEENRGFFGWIADRFKDIIGGIAAIVTLLLGIVYLVLVFVAIGLILMIAGCLYLLQQIELNPDLIKTNFGIVLATGEQVINSIFNRQDPETNQSDGSGRKGFGDWIMEMLGSILGGIGKIMKLILSILYLVMLFIAIGLIAGIVAALNKIAEFNLNSAAIKAKVTAIFVCAQTVMDKVYETKESNKGKNSGGFWANVLKGLGFSAVGDLLNFIADYAYLSRVLSSIQLVSKLANSLNTIKDISVKEDAIKKSISSIFRLSNLVEIKLKGVTTKNVWEQEGAAKHLVRLYQSIKLAGIEISKIPTDLESNLQIVDNILKVIKSPISKDALSTHKEMIDNYIKFLDKVDRVDIETLRTTERLFKNMAQFSESIHGNFQGLADALNEKIAPLLEELKDLLKEVKPSIEQASKDTQASITYNATGNSERAAQKAGMTQEQVQQVRQTEENRKRANYERLAAIDKIVKLLEGEYKNGAKVRMS